MVVGLLRPATAVATPATPATPGTPGTPAAIGLDSWVAGMVRGEKVGGMVESVEVSGELENRKN